MDDYYFEKYIKALIDHFGKEILQKEATRFCLKDRFILYDKFGMNVLNHDELKQYMLNCNKGYNMSSELAENEENALFESLIEVDCSKREGIEKVTRALEYYNYYKEPVLDNTIIKEKEQNNYDVENRKNKLIVAIKECNNQYLRILVSAMFNQNFGVTKYLKEIFYMFPVLVQIQFVKRLFSSMVLGKIQDKTVSTIKNMISDGQHELCMPLTIVFKFLEMKQENPNDTITDRIMTYLIKEREDYYNWIYIKYLLNPCIGRTVKDFQRYGYYGISHDDAWHNFYGLVQKCYVIDRNVLRLTIFRNQIDVNEKQTRYANKVYYTIIEYIHNSFNKSDYKEYSGSDTIIYFNVDCEMQVRVMCRNFRIKLKDADYDIAYRLEKSEKKLCCSCRTAEKVDDATKLPFMWCNHNPCFEYPLRLHIPSEWQNYTVLDFMHILSLPLDYTNKDGKRTKFGQYIIFSDYMQKFEEFIEHLKCRKCGKFMEPIEVSNFAKSPVLQYECRTPGCDQKGKAIYLNRCFNPKCKSIIDSRDSKSCPNGWRICQKCGSCCSDAEFKKILDRRKITTGTVEASIIEAVRRKIGHLGKTLYCANCGIEMVKGRCPNCGKTYEIEQQEIK